MLDGSEQVNCWLRFEFQSSYVIENRNNLIIFHKLSWIISSSQLLSETFYVRMVEN